MFVDVGVASEVLRVEVKIVERVVVGRDMFDTRWQETGRKCRGGLIYGDLMDGVQKGTGECSRY